MVGTLVAVRGKLVNGSEHWLWGGYGYDLIFSKMWLHSEPCLWNGKSFVVKQETIAVV